MKRFAPVLLSVLFSAIFSLSPVLAVVAATPENNLPACCRKDGRHRCAMSQGSQRPDGPVFAANTKCPSFPGTMVTRGNSPTAIQAQMVDSVAPDAEHSPLTASGASPASKDPSRTNRERGPPHSLPLSS